MLIRISPRLAGVSGRGFDTDAAAYVRAVEAADGQQLEQAVAIAYNDFVVGCKADGIWSAIQACCILCGARTLSGALTPLVGSAPTNNGPFVSGDYTRGGASPGIVGNGSTKYLSSGRADNADGQNDFHGCVWASTLNSGLFSFYFGARSAGATTMTEMSQYHTGGNSELCRCRVSNGGGVAGTPATGFKGLARSASASFTARTNGSTTTITESSVAPSSNTLQVLAIGGTTAARGDGRVAFYSFGSALTLSTLESRVSTLITAIGAAV